MSVALTVVKAIVPPLVKRLVGAETRRLEDVRREIYDEIILDCQKNLEQVIAQQIEAGVDVQALKAEIDRLQNDGTDARVLNATTIEAMRSVSKERIKLLASAFAGFFLPDLEREEKERAFRTALALEPSDVRFLRGYGPAIEYRGGGAPTHVANVSAYLKKNRLHVHVLVTAGCLAMQTDQDDPESRGDFFPLHSFTSVAPNVTRIGAAVLRLLSTYNED